MIDFTLKLVFEIGVTYNLPSTVVLVVVDASGNGQKKRWQVYPKSMPKSLILIIIFMSLRYLQNTQSYFSVVFINSATTALPLHCHCIELKPKLYCKLQLQLRGSICSTGGSVIHTPFLRAYDPLGIRTSHENAHNAFVVRYCREASGAMNSN